MYPDIALLILRVVIGGVVMQHGLLKLGWVGTGGSVPGVGKWFDSMGMKPGILWAVVATTAEALGGALTVLGLGGPIGPGLLAGDLLVVTIVAHWQQGFWAGGGKVGWEFPLPLAAASLAIALLGNGGWSLDAVLRLTYGSTLVVGWLALMFAGALAALVIRAIMAPKPAPQKAA